MSIVSDCSQYISFLLLCRIRALLFQFYSHNWHHENILNYAGSCFHSRLSILLHSHRSWHWILFEQIFADKSFETRIYFARKLLGYFFNYFTSNSSFYGDFQYEIISRLLFRTLHLYLQPLHQRICPCWGQRKNGFSSAIDENIWSNICICTNLCLR